LQFVGYVDDEFDLDLRARIEAAHFGVQDVAAQQQSLSPVVQRLAQLGLGGDFGAAVLGAGLSQVVEFLGAIVFQRLVLLELEVADLSDAAEPRQVDGGVVGVNQFEFRFVQADDGNGQGYFDGGEVGGVDVQLLDEALDSVLSGVLGLLDAERVGQCGLRAGLLQLSLVGQQLRSGGRLSSEPLPIFHTHYRRHKRRLVVDIESVHKVPEYHWNSCNQQQLKEPNYTTTRTIFRNLSF